VKAFLKQRFPSTAARLAQLRAALGLSHEALARTLFNQLFSVKATQLARLQQAFRVSQEVLAEKDAQLTQLQEAFRVSQEAARQAFRASQEALAEKDAQLIQLQEAFRLSQEGLAQKDGQLTHLQEVLRVSQEMLAQKDAQLNAQGLAGIPVTPIGDEAIAEACLRLRASGPVRHDVGSPRCAHAIVTMDDGSPAWLKVTGLTKSNRDRARQREIGADGLTGLPKPRLIRDAEWEKDGIFWRAYAMTLAPSPAAGRRPWLAPSSSTLPEKWFIELRQAVSALLLVRTPWYVVTPEEVRELIATYLGPGLPSKAETWHVTHGDLTWSNITAPNLTLLDWENWGLAPQGYGLGRLLTFSLLEPELAARLERAFAAEFRSQSGFVGLLAAVAVVKRQIRTGGGIPSSLEEPIESLVRRICQRQHEFLPCSEIHADSPGGRLPCRNQERKHSL
jgi:hypothetical protein